MRLLPFLALPLVVACHAPDEEHDPSVHFLSPDEGTMYMVGDVEVRIAVDDFVLVVPGTVPFDEEGPPSGFCDLALDDDHVDDLVETHTLVGVGLMGSHTLTCTLRFADGEQLDPPVSASVAFEIG